MKNGTNKNKINLFSSRTGQDGVVKKSIDLFSNAVSYISYKTSLADNLTAKINIAVRDIRIKIIGNIFPNKVNFNITSSIILNLKKNLLAKKSYVSLVVSNVEILAKKTTNLPIRQQINFKQLVVAYSKIFRLGEYSLSTLSNLNGLTLATLGRRDL